MTNTPRRAFDAFPRWMGHPAVVVSYGLLVISSGWALVDAIADDSRWNTVMWRVVVFAGMSWLLWVTASVWRRRRRGAVQD